jgi:crotonobetainyl-CoA:carnitine CoA-transferase CaiB-like acyl-CoA transferase
VTRADVLLVEAPSDGKLASPIGGGRNVDPQHLAAYNIMSRNKRSIVLNLREQEAREIFYKLADTADVVLEGFRPGVVKRLGVDYDTLKERNPRLVYCSLSGFGQTGPYSQLVGHDINYISVAGALGMIGWPDTPPAIPMNIIADFAGGGMHAAYGILAALHARDRSGKGQYVDIAMSDGVLYLLDDRQRLLRQRPRAGTRRHRSQRQCAALQRLPVFRWRLDQPWQPGAALLRELVQGDGPRRLHPAPVRHREARRDIRSLPPAVCVQNARRVVRDPQADRYLRRAHLLPG